jgi:hypothetical protein
MNARTQSNVAKSRHTEPAWTTTRAAGVRSSCVLALNALAGGARSGSLIVLGAVPECVLDISSNGVTILAHGERNPPDDARHRVTGAFEPRLRACGRASERDGRADLREERIPDPGRLHRDPRPTRLVDAEGLSGIVRTVPGVGGVRSERVRCRASGHLFADVTILVDGPRSVSATRDFTDDVERAIAREPGTAGASAHAEPARAR